jgi:hypothetical protein
VADPSRPNFQPEIITGRPNFIQDPVFNDPQIGGHRPDFNPPVQTSRPPFNDPSGQTRPDYNPGSPVSDGYGAPLAPVITEKPTYNAPTGRPSYRPRPSKGGPNFLGPIASLIDAKRRAVASILHGFRAPKFLRGSRPQHQRPSYSRPQPQFKLPFLDGFGFGKPKGRPSRPSHTRPSSEYGAPAPTSRPTYQPRPSYNRPPRKTEFSGDPRADDRHDLGDVAETLSVNCGEPGAIRETFATEFVFRSPGYPDNYPDSTNCSVNIFPRKDVCALGLELVSVGSLLTVLVQKFVKQYLHKCVG